MAHQNRQPLYREAQDELELYFASADATLGLHGTGFEGGALAWDQSRIDELHWAKRRHEHREGLDYLADVTPNVLGFRAVYPECWRDACVTFTPRRWPVSVSAELSRGQRGGNLVGLALLGSVLRAEWVRRERGKLEAACKSLMRGGDYEGVIDVGSTDVDPTSLQLLAFASAEAESTDKARVKKFFDPVRREAEKSLERALEAYDGILRAKHADAIAEAKSLAAAS